MAKYKVLVMNFVFISAGSGNEEPPDGLTPTDDDLITADFLNIRPEAL
tara:strand:+ start:543 stop:686 length:144 start_codon:yes stop_codon:yes gene_type:complete